MKKISQSRSWFTEWERKDMLSALAKTAGKDYDPNNPHHQEPEYLDFIEMHYHKNSMNRTISDSTADQYAEDMKTGEWDSELDGGPAVMVNSDGKLVAGQHRGWGFIRSGKPTITFLTLSDATENEISFQDLIKARLRRDSVRMFMSTDMRTQIDGLSPIFTFVTMVAAGGILVATEPKDETTDETKEVVPTAEKIYLSLNETQDILSEIHSWFEADPKKPAQRGLTKEERKALAKTRSEERALLKKNNLLGLAPVLAASVAAYGSTMNKDICRNIIVQLRGNKIQSSAEVKKAVDDIYKLYDGRIRTGGNHDMKVFYSVLKCFAIANGAALESLMDNKSIMEYFSDETDVQKSQEIAA